MDDHRGFRRPFGLFGFAWPVMMGAFFALLIFAVPRGIGVPGYRAVLHGGGGA
jgi:hypothetical protein